MATIAELLQATSLTLEAVSASARLDAEVLLSHLLHCSRAQLIARSEHKVDPQLLTDYQRLIDRRLRKEPIAYLVEHKEFWSLPLRISPAVLVPRPETEHVVETALQLISQPHALVADIGTGSGAIALALASERRHWRIVASDISAAALAVASHNAERLELTHIDFRLGAWTAALPQAEAFDAIISNPPYLADNDPHLGDSEISHEPRLALVADEQGLAAYRILCNQAVALLKPKGLLLFEHGASQAEAVQSLLHQAGFVEVQTHPDFAGLPRLSFGYKG